MGISVIIPTLEEETTIGPVIEGCLRHTDDILVVDGFSQDGTSGIAASYPVRFVQEHSRGKGEALRRAVDLVRGEIVVFIDGDGSHDPQDIPRLLEPIRRGEADLVVASRITGGSSELHGGFDQFFRLAGAAFITTCVNKRFGVDLSDCENGFRAVRREVFLHIGLTARIATIEQEMVMNALARGYRVAEVPSHEHVRAGGASKIRLSRVWPHFVWGLVRGLLQRSVPRRES